MIQGPQDGDINEMRVTLGGIGGCADGRGGVDNATAAFLTGKLVQLGGPELHIVCAVFRETTGPGMTTAYPTPQTR